MGFGEGGGQRRTAPAKALHVTGVIVGDRVLPATKGDPDRVEGECTDGGLLVVPAVALLLIVGTGGGYGNAGMRRERRPSGPEWRTAAAVRKIAMKDRPTNKPARLRASDQEIKKWLLGNHGFVPESAWIHHCKALFGIPGGPC